MAALTPEVREINHFAHDSHTVESLKKTVADLRKGNWSKALQRDYQKSSW